MNDITQILYSIVAAVAVTLGLPVKFPNKETPANDGKWLEVIHIPNGGAKSEWNDNGNNQGLLRVLVNWPVNRGDHEPGDACSEIAAQFVQGARLFSDDGLRVVEIYDKTTIGGVVEDGQKVLYPVTVRYRSFPI